MRARPAANWHCHNIGRADTVYFTAAVASGYVQSQREVLLSGVLPTANSAQRGHRPGTIVGISAVCVYTAMLRTNPSQLSSGVGPVIISFALVWNFRFILTHVRGVLSELMGTSAQLPSWHKALTHHTRRSVVSTYLALSAGTCAYLAQHWWFGPVTSWQDWRKSYGTCVPSPGVWQPHRLTWACPSSCLPGVGIKTCAYGVLGTVDPVAHVCVPTS